jgi:hypothetical protein
MLMLMMRWEPVRHRTMWQQHCKLRNSSSGLTVYSSSLILAEGCGVGRKDLVNKIYGQSQLSFSSQPNLHTVKKGLQNCLIILWPRKMNKAEFFFYCDTLLASERVIVTEKESLVFPENYILQIIITLRYLKSISKILIRSTEQIKKDDKEE